MKVKGIAILFLVLASSPLSFPQDSSETSPFDAQHILSVSSGVNMHTVRDELMSPLMYSGTRLPVSLSYRYRGAHERHAVTLGYSNGTLESSITNMRTAAHYIDDLHLNIEYSYLTRITSIDKYNTSCFLGGSLTGLLDLRTHHFTRAQSHVNAEQMTGLGVCVLTETYFQEDSKNLLRCEVVIPVVSYAVLTNHFNVNVSGSLEDIDYDRSVVWQVFTAGDFVSFGSLVHILANISYSIFIGEHLGIDLQYNFRYYSFEQFPDLFHARVLTNRVLLGLQVAL